MNTHIARQFAGLLERRTLEATLRRCTGQCARPVGVSRRDERDAMDRGLLRFNEWPSGHYQITDAGREFLSGEGAA